MFAMLRKISGTGRQATSPHNKQRCRSFSTITRNCFLAKTDMLNALRTKDDKFIKNGALASPNESDNNVTRRGMIWGYPPYGINTLQNW